MNSSTTTAMAHSSMPWMPMATRAARGRGVPLARACLGRRRGPCSPPGLLRSPRLTSPGRRGCGCRRGPGPAEGGGGELGRPGGRTRHSGEPERNFPSQPANFEARRRGAQVGRPARARDASMARAGAAPLSPPLQPRGLGGTGARRRRGSRALPAAPGSIAAPRALIGLGAATTRGGVPCGAPPPRPARAREGAEGGGPAPRGPAPGPSLARSHRHPASPREAARSAVSPNCPCRVGAEWLGKGPGTGGEKSRSLALREESGLQTPG